jgi:hypothetical protein
MVVLTSSFTWRNFDISTLFTAALGAEQYVLLSSGEFGNYLQDFFDNRWTAENPDASGPRVYNRADQYWAAQRNTYFLRSTDHLRLRNLKVAYNFSEDLLSQIGIKHVQVYFSGMNLFVWDTYKVADPESDSETASNYPQRRLFNLGYELNFLNK